MTVWLLCWPVAMTVIVSQSSLVEFIIILNCLTTLLLFGVCRRLNNNLIVAMGAKSFTELESLQRLWVVQSYTYTYIHTEIIGSPQGHMWYVNLVLFINLYALPCKVWPQSSYSVVAGRGCLWLIVEFYYQLIQGRLTFWSTQPELDDVCREKRE